MWLRITESSTQANVSARASPPSEQTLRKSAHDFEAMMIDQMIQPMFATLGQEQGMFDGGAAEQTLRPLLLTEFSKMMEARGGFGLEPAITAALAQQTRQR